MILWLNFQKKRGLLVYRGSTNNVFKRILQAGISQNAEYVMRVNCDSPFIDESLVITAIDAYRIYSPDIITNLMPRTYPYGITIQILKVSTMLDLINNCPPSPEESEHITPYIEKNKKQVQIFNIFNKKPIFTNKRFVVDTIEDYVKLYMELELCLCSKDKTSRITWSNLLDTQKD